MGKLAHTVFRCAWAASLTIAVLALSLWAIRGHCALSFDNHWLARRFEVINSGGILFVEWAELRRATDGAWILGAQMEIDSTVLGFAFLASVECGIVAVPKWAILAAAILTTVVLHHMCNRSQRCPDRCMKCDYDLRASADRCPECGTPVPTGHVPKVGPDADKGT